MLSQPTDDMDFDLRASMDSACTGTSLSRAIIESYCTMCQTPTVVVDSVVEKDLSNSTLRRGDGLVVC